MAKEKVPWNQTVLYQIYPWSFNEDKAREQRGHGSIDGITEKIPYISKRGFNAIWISPHYPSPMIDGGYDVADYIDIHPALGTLEDFDELVDECHTNGLRIMLDFIPNHSSNEHEWFQKSRQRADGLDDWYIWHPGKLDENGNRVPPNNWGSVFSKPMKKARLRGEMPWLRDDEPTPYNSAWQWDDERGEFYLHSFAVEQPDLNWSNPDVRHEMIQNMRFWYDRGVDGFRVDAVNHTGKNMALTDEMFNPAYNEKDFCNPFDRLVRWESAGNPEPLHKYVSEMAQAPREEKYRGRNIHLVLEAYMNAERLRSLGEVDPNVAEPFNFGAMRLPWTAADHKKQVDDYYADLPDGAKGNQVNGNHDTSRLASRLGDTAARAAIMMKTLLPGMMIVYNGEELGMHDARIPADKIQDPNGLRDPFRTPPIWDHTQPNAGFSNAPADELWLPVNENDLHLSVINQEQDPASNLSMTDGVVRLRHESTVFREGKYVPLDADNPDVFAFGRQAGDEQAMVLTNFTDETQEVRVSRGGEAFGRLGRAVLSSIDVASAQEILSLADPIRLQPNESLAVIAR